MTAWCTTPPTPPDPTNPGADGEAALVASREHRDRWWRYRGKLGFVTMLLRRTS